MTLAPKLPLRPSRLLNDTINYLHDARAHGDFMHGRLFGRSFAISYDPDIAEHVLVKNQKNYRKDEYLRRAHRVFGNGLIRADGEPWLRQRRIMQPGFHRQRIKGYADTMSKLSDTFVAELLVGKDFDVQQSMSLLTLEIAVQTMFGQSAKTDAAIVGEHFHHITDRFAAFGYLLEPDWWPSPSQLRYKRAVKALDGIIHRYIVTRKEALTDDVLSMLLEMRDEDGRPMSDKQVRDEVMTLFLAGHETTALTLTYAWRFLAMHADVSKKLHEEVSAASDETLHQLPLLDAVIKETLRLLPPAYVIPREAIEPDQLGGFDIPAGTQVLIAVCAMHRDPRAFANPEAFDPTRWLSEQKHHRYSYFPFGGGPRMCIGAAFADMELKIALAKILRRYRPEILSDAPLDLVPSITQRPRGSVMARVSAWS